MIKIIARLNKVQRLSLAVLFFVLLCRLGGLTGAWLMNKDAVTNVFGIHDYFLDIVLTEPNWTAVGSEQASKMQPGMDIFKDPRVANITEDSCFVRMKIIVADSSGTPLEDGERKTAILNAIRYCKNDKSTDTVSDDEFTDINPDFKKENGWYYYMDGDNCAVVESYQSTEPLFTDVIIPKTKNDYVYFKDGFIITVVAEAVYTGGLTDKGIASVAQRFDGSVEEVTDGESGTEESETDKNTSGGSSSVENGNGTSGTGTETGSGNSAGIGGGGVSGIESDEDVTSVLSVLSAKNSSTSGNGVMMAVSHSGFGTTVAIPSQDITADNITSGAAAEVGR